MYIGAVHEPAFAGYLLVELGLPVEGPVDLGKDRRQPKRFCESSRSVLSSSSVPALTMNGSLYIFTVL